jgi:hypothetical protein
MDEQATRASQRGRGPLLRTRASCFCEHVADGLPRASHAGCRRRAGTPGGAPRHDVAGEPREQAAEPGGAAHRAEATTGPWPRASSQGGPAQDARGRAGRHGRAPAAMAEPRHPAESRWGQPRTGAPSWAQGEGARRRTEPGAGEPCRRAMAARTHAGRAAAWGTPREQGEVEAALGLGHASRDGEEGRGKRGREGGRRGRGHLGESRTAGGTSGARRSSTICVTAILRGREARTGELREVREKRTSWGWRR